jgi:hypothetical protein
VICVDREVVDYGGQANGRPDPGELVDLITTVKNFGAHAANVQLTLDTNDPYITIVDGSADVGDIATGDAVANSADPFSFEVAAHAPTGHIVELSLRATYTGGDDLSALTLCIGRFDYLVWDPTSDQSSGPVIAATLEGLSYTGTLRTDLPLDRLDDYATLWVSCGMYAENYRVPGGAAEGTAIVNYMSNGGSVYLEGGDVWAFDPQTGGFDFRSYFGIAATVDGTGDLSHVVGVPGEFTEGMDFVYAGENAWVDHLVPSGHGFALLSNSSPAYHCGIAGDAGAYRTVGTSFEFGGLQDGAQPSTKAALASAIMGFFLVQPPEVLFADGFESGDLSGW